MTTKAINFNVVENEIEILRNEMDEFVSYVQSTKDGKSLSYEYLKNIFFLWKIQKLQNELKNKAEYRKPIPSALDNMTNLDRQ